MQIETQVIVTKNAIIRIHHPDITDEERARRMKAIELAAIRLVRANRQAEAAAGKCCRCPGIEKTYIRTPLSRVTNNAASHRGLDAV